MRTSQRSSSQLREIRITRRYTKHAEGSVLIECGDTKVICTASVEERVPPHKKGSGEGWVTAEYGMLPRSTGERMGREAAKGKQSGRTQEIQRLIGRSLRAVVDLKKLGERTIQLAKPSPHFLLHCRSKKPHTSPRINGLYKFIWLAAKEWQKSRCGRSEKTR